MALLMHIENKEKGNFDITLDEYAITCSFYSKTIGSLGSSAHEHRALARRDQFYSLVSKHIIPQLQLDMDEHVPFETSQPDMARYDIRFNFKKPVTLSLIETFLNYPREVLNHLMTKETKICFLEAAKSYFYHHTQVDPSLRDQMIKIKINRTRSKDLYKPLAMQPITLEDSPLGQPAENQEDFDFKTSVPTAKPIAQIKDQEEQKRVSSTFNTLYSLYDYAKFYGWNLYQRPLFSRPSKEVELQEIDSSTYPQQAR